MTRDTETRTWSPLPPTTAVLREQFLTVVGRFGLPTLLTALAVTVLATLYAVVIRPAGTPAAAGELTWQQLPYVLMAQGLLLAVAFFLPGSIWRGLPPGNRRSLHAHPVDRKQHELLRVMAGGLALGGVAVPTYLVGIVLQARLGANGLTWPSLPGWGLAAASVMLIYLIGSWAGLRTASATGTLVRLTVWGFMATLLLAILTEYTGMLAAESEAMVRLAFTGEWGVIRAVRAGFSGLVSAPDAVPAHLKGLTLWLTLAAGLVWTSAGRSPRH